MKRQSVIAAISLLSLVGINLILSGCSVTQTAYMQDADVTSPVHVPPVQVADSLATGDFRFSVSLNLVNQNQIDALAPNHSKVNAGGVYQVDTIRTGSNQFSFQETPGANNRTFAGRSFHWSPAPSTLSLDAQIMASKGVAFTGGMTYGSRSGSTYWGWRIGMGLVGIGNGVGYRLDGGVYYHALRSVVQSVVNTKVVTIFGSQDEHVVFYEDDVKESFFDFYGSVTLNTRGNHWPVQFLLNGAVIAQTYYKFRPHTIDPHLFAPFTPLLFTDINASPDEDVQYTGTLWVVTPALYVDLNDKFRLIAGARYVITTEFDNVSVPGFWMPFGQIQMGL